MEAQARKDMLRAEAKEILLADHAVVENYFNYR